PSDGSPRDLQSFTTRRSSDLRAPVLAQPANMTVNEGATADQSLSATDADGDALTFSLASGPAYASVTTTTPGTGTAAGNLHLAPGFSDAGTANATVSVSDGSLNNTKSLNVTVNNVDRAPVMGAVANQTVAEGSTADVAVSATDADGDVITLSASLPTFASLTSSPAAGTVNGTIHIAPAFGDAGSYA